MTNTVTIEVTPELLKKILRYDRTSGKLYWRSRPMNMFCDARTYKMWTTRFEGKEAMTSNSHGYKMGYIINKMYLAHRVIWAMETGSWPTDEIDHIDHDRSNNRICNLREVSAYENRRNHSLQAVNTSGVTGVSWKKERGKWHAWIGEKGRQIHLGYFDDISHAKSAREKGELKYGYHENHGRTSI